MKTTKNYQLNQWEAHDRVLREDFNSDNAKIDEVLCGKGNCQIETGTYVGTGEAGQFKPTRLTLAKRPLLLIVTGSCTLIIPGTVDSGASVPVGTQGNDYNSFSWNGSTVTWHHYDTPRSQLNEAGVTYRYLAVYTN